MSSAFILDAWAVLAYLQREEPACQRLIAAFKGARDQEIKLSISLINLGEVYYRIGKAHGQAQADAALHNLRRLPVAILEVDETAVLAAASLKMRLAISYADAFAVAAALRQDAVLLTGDPELVSLEGQFPIEKLSRKSRS